MARVAFVMDKPLPKIGLSGRAKDRAHAHRLRLLRARYHGHRTVSSDRDRKMTILLTPPYELLSARSPFTPSSPPPSAPSIRRW